MRKILLNIVVGVGMIMPVLIQPGIAFAGPNNCPSGNSAQGQVVTGIGETGTCNDSGIVNVIHTAVNILSIVVGVAAVIMIVVSGLKYITSGGDSAKVANAKGTLIYAVIGVVIAALAQVIVHFVLFQTSSSAGTS